jgi:hypothetical protein
VRRNLPWLIPALALASLTACNNRDSKGQGDAPVGERHEAPREVWLNIDKFPNVSAFCIGPHGAYTESAHDRVWMIEDDANCDEGGVLNDG